MIWKFNKGFLLDSSDYEQTELKDLSDYTYINYIYHMVSSF